jgi:hypothetical protein
MKKSLVFFCALLMMQTAVSQPVSKYTPLMQKYAHEQAIILKESQHIDISLKADSLQIFSQNFLEKLFIQERNEYLSDEYIHTNYFVKASDIEPFLFKADGKKYKKTSCKNVKYQENFGSGSFYDDNKIAKVIFPKINPGDRTQLSYNETFKEPYFLGSFYFGSYLKTLDAEFSVSHSPKVNINYKIFNDPDGRILYSKTEKSGKVVHTWKATSMPAYDYSRAQFRPSYYQPHIVAYITDYQQKEKKIHVLSDVDDLYKVYYNWVKNTNLEIDPNLKKFTDSLVGKNTDERQKLEKIFKWVQKNVQYIAFEDGYSGFVPSPAGEVFQKRYGDCKGKSSILKAMLNIAGIKAYWTWIGTRHLPYSYKDVPTPINSNHMICTALIDNHYYFLDATDPYIPFDKPTEMIQGKDALIGLDKEKWEIKKVETVNKEYNVVTDSLFIDLQDKELWVCGKYSVKGYRAGDLAEAISSKTDKQLKEYFKTIFEKGNNKFRLDSFSTPKQIIENENNTVTYAGVVPDYIKKIEGTLYINLNLVKPQINNTLDTADILYDKKIPYKAITRNIFIFNIPKSYKVNYLPPSDTFTGDGFSFSIRYWQEAEKIYLEQIFETNTLQISQKQFKEWNEMIKRLNKNYSESVLLTNTNK